MTSSQSTLDRTTLPAVWRATEQDPPLPEFVLRARDKIRDLVHRHGAVLLRGWPVEQASELDRLVEAMGGSTVDYKDAATPRSKVSGGVYTSTDYPASEWIELHHEGCYTETWPGLLYFACAQAAPTGGATTIADSRAILADLPDAVVERFRAQGVSYVRTFHPRLGLSWCDVLGVDDRAEAVRLCEQRGIEAEWLADDILQTRQTWPATLRHPVTGEETWFNQIVAFHPLSLPDDLRSGLVHAVGEQRLPKQVRYGTGEEIEPEVIAQIKHVYDEQTVQVPWQDGDVLLVDNILAAHGRAPFRGKRRVLVAMSHAQSWHDHVERATR